MTSTICWLVGIFVYFMLIKKNSRCHCERELADGGKLEVWNPAETSGPLCSVLMDSAAVERIAVCQLLHSLVGNFHPENCAPHFYNVFYNIYNNVLIVLNYNNNLIYKVA